MKKFNDENGILGDYLRYGHLGITFILIFGMFLALGYWLDDVFGTYPWIFAFSAIPGCLAGFYILYKEFISKVDKNSK